MNATNKKAIQILKSKMSLEERKALVSNVDILDYKKAHNIWSLFYSLFIWKNSKQGSLYWINISYRFTEKELQQKIDIK